MRVVSCSTLSTSETYERVELIKLSLQVTDMLITWSLLRHPLCLRSSQHWVFLCQSLHLTLINTRLHSHSHAAFTLKSSRLHQ